MFMSNLACLYDSYASCVYIKVLGSLALGVL